MHTEQLNQQENTQGHTNDIECGNCWGHQEWNDEVVEKGKKKAKPAKEAFILEWVKKHSPLSK
jgi:hypothetical protein